MRSSGKGLLGLAVAAVALLSALIVPPTAAFAASGDVVAPMQERPPAPGTPKLGLPSAGGAVTGTPTSRLCSGHGVEYGDWVNADPATRSIVRAQLRDCQPVTTCTGDICTITYDAGWSMHLFGACSPTPCDWGWSAGRFRLSNGQIPATYDQGFAKRYVWAAMSQYRPGQLWIAVRTDFTDPARPDYESQDWFVRA
ncbi:hypothetical protein AB0J80_28365 [Actinoplanes sp. NPDC049548]|uniref:hypothetical protein n=1 Tax=Actinoplanes sp. NPDC049548 TaxID=3155152 RepID=UPI0034445D44